MQLFAPDGGFEEGPAYWTYATIYNVLYINSLDTALGTDFGAAERPGFSLTPEYRIQAIGPTNLYANFGDANTAVSPAPQMFWFAQHFHHPAYAVIERELATALDGHMDSYTLNDSERFAALGLFWSALVTEPDKTSEPALVQSFSRVNQAYMRSAWHDHLAWYIGFKGGDTRASHAHLDLGTFLFDALGQRWGVDLGPDNYGLPGYFGNQRWSYYRLGTEGHNTITINGQNEGLDAKAPLSTVGADFAVVNLDQAYKGKLQSWTRGIRLVDGQRILVEDELTPRPGRRSLEFSHRGQCADCTGWPLRKPYPEWGDHQRPHPFSTQRPLRNRQHRDAATPGPQQGHHQSCGPFAPADRLPDDRCSFCSP